MENSSQKSQEDLVTNKDYEGLSNKSTAGSDDDEELIFVDTSRGQEKIARERPLDLLKRPSLSRQEKKLHKLNYDKDRNNFVKKWISDQTNEKIDESDADEFVFLDLHHQHDEMMEEIASQTTNTSQKLEQLSNLEVENEKDNFVRNWVSDVVKSSLNDLESEDAALSLSTISSDTDTFEIASKITTNTKNEDSTKCAGSMSSHRRLYSKSSFFKNTASSLQQENLTQASEKRRTPHQGILKQKREMSGYARFARTTRVPEKCPQTKSQDNVIVRTKSGFVNFIARNKSLASSYGNRVLAQKTQRRPMTSVCKEQLTVDEKSDSKITKDDVPCSPAKSKEEIRNKEHNLATTERKRILSAQWSVLSDKQLASFQKLFNSFDQSKSGGISAEELHFAVKELMPHETIQFEDVRKVHAELDIKNTGEIEFDEFMYAMTNPKNYMKLIHDDDKEQLSKDIRMWEEFQSDRISRRSVSFRASLKKESISPGERKEPLKSRGNIFFSMVRTATKKDSMKEIRHYYVSKIKRLSDHVIHDWSEGQRCIGLSDRGVLKRYSHIMKELQERKASFANEKVLQDSPYAKPLLMGLAELKRNSDAKRQSLRAERIPKILKQPVVEKKSQDDTNRASTIPRSSIVTEPPELKIVSLKKVRIADGAPKLTKRPIRKVAELEQDFSMRRPHLEATVRKEVFKAYAVPASEMKFSDLLGKKEANTRPGFAGPMRRIKVSEFVETPKMVPLPVYPIEKLPPKLNFHHVEELRKQAALILQEYYSKLKKVSAKNSKDIYKKLRVHQIPNEVLQRHFRNSYLAYSGDNEPFVVSPWIPFPFPSPWVQNTSTGKRRPETAWI